MRARHPGGGAGQRPPRQERPGPQDVKDSEWLAQLLECGLLRGSFIPPKEIAAIRELTRYRKKTIQTRTRELQRLSKVLEDAGIKIDSVASSITTLSARDMIEALIAGQRDPRVLAWIVDYQGQCFTWPDYPVEGTPDRDPPATASTVRPT